MDKSHLYQLAPDVELEFFEEKAIVFQSEKDSFMVVNRTVAVFLDIIASDIGGKSFSSGELLEVIRQKYAINQTEIQKMIAFCLKHDLLLDMNHGEGQQGTD
jgi:hypothetical protein